MIILNYFYQRAYADDITVFNTSQEDITNLNQTIGVYKKPLLLDFKSEGFVGRYWVSSTPGWVTVETGQIEKIVIFIRK